MRPGCLAHINGLKIGTRTVRLSVPRKPGSRLTGGGRRKTMPLNKNKFTKTGQAAWMVYNDGNPAKWCIKQVKWIASTTDGIHVIEEPVKGIFGDIYEHLRQWKYVFETKEAAIEYANKRISEIKYIKIGEYNAAE
jgi:hypothetical protein